VQLENTFADKVPFFSKYWGFKKPGVEVGAYMFKNSKGQFYVYAFSEDWIKNNLSFDTLSKNNSFQNFLNSNNGFITYQDIVPNAAVLSMEAWNTLRNFKDNSLSKTILKSQTLSLVTTFFKNAFESDRETEKNNFEDLDYRKIAKSEKLIIDSLTTSFLGIETIAQLVNMSPSKLKTNFKSVYGTSMMQYHIDKKMQLAMQLIQNTDLPIKNITYEVGYESASKFAATFRKRFGKLPSEFRKTD
jgi:AraC-like DNA-binding protein